MNSFDAIYRQHRDFLIDAPLVDVGEWHAMDVKGKPELVTREIYASFKTWIPPTVEEAQERFKPNLPWAESQFLERVSGLPLNPGVTYLEWPWQSQMDRHIVPVFSHTYMERYWPKHAHREGVREPNDRALTPRVGIRYAYGDLQDVVALLARSPYTRQAYLPVWFPEDTGALHRGRLPCSLGYHFLLRNGHFNVSYFIRSCDFVRHFRDDVYLTARLAQWVVSELSGVEPFTEVRPGTLNFVCPSLHIMEGDRAKLQRERGSSDSVLPKKHKAGRNP
jgi:hypothetical protein